MMVVRTRVSLQWDGGPLTGNWWGWCRVASAWAHTLVRLVWWGRCDVVRVTVITRPVLCLVTGHSHCCRQTCVSLLVSGPVLSLPAPHSLVEARGTVPLVAFTAQAPLASHLALCGSAEGQASSGGRPDTEIDYWGPELWWGNYHQSAGQMSSQPPIHQRHMSPPPPCPPPSPPCSVDQASSWLRSEMTKWKCIENPIVIPGSAQMSSASYISNNRWFSLPCMQQ